MLCDGHEGTTGHRKRMTEPLERLRGLRFCGACDSRCESTGQSHLRSKLRNPTASFESVTVFSVSSSCLGGCFSLSVVRTVAQSPPIVSTCHSW